MFVRSSHNPILKPDKSVSWRSLKVYNPTVLFENSKYHLFYRAVGKDKISRIGYAISTDGINFSQQKKPNLSPKGKLESKGIEDPRITKVKNKYFLTFTAFDGRTARLSLATGDKLNYWKDRGAELKNWDFKKNYNFIVPWDTAFNNPAEDKNWSKAGAIFPEIIAKKYLMLFGDRNIWLAKSTNGVKWHAENFPLLHPRDGNYFDNVHLEMGPPPIRTKKGWLVIYHGVDRKMVYRLGYALLDSKNPEKILYRCKKPIFEPKEKYELKGSVDIAKGYGPKVIFCCGAVLVDDILRIFYGAGDSVICTAAAPLKEIIGK